jgi:two-component system sensor histidine kinase/response regulator
MDERGHAKVDVDREGVDSHSLRAGKQDSTHREQTSEPGSGPSRAPGGGSSAVVYNREAALERVDGDEVFLGELVDIFLAERPRLMSEIHDAIQRGDPVSVKRSAHALKGALANFCAESAYQAALSLEEIGRRGELQGAPTAYATLVEILARLEEALTRVP